MKKEKYFGKTKAFSYLELNYYYQYDFNFREIFSGVDQIKLSKESEGIM